jgi:hypothetical protein
MNRDPLVRKQLSTKATLWIALVAVALLLSQCASIGFPTEGVVMDAGTQKPMAGVWVSQGWYGTAFCIPIPAPHSSCGQSLQIASAITQTDEQGRFRFDRPSAFRDGRWGWFSVHPSFAAITLGYEADPGDRYRWATDDMHRWQDRDITIVMTKLAGSRVEVLAKLAERLTDDLQYRLGTPDYVRLEESQFELMRAIGVTPYEWAVGIEFGFAYRRGELTKTSSVTQIEQLSGVVSSRAASRIQENYAPYGRYVEYLKRREKP